MRDRSGAGIVVILASLTVAVFWLSQSALWAENLIQKKVVRSAGQIVLNIEAFYSGGSAGLQSFYKEVNGAIAANLLALRVNQGDKVYISVNLHYEDQQMPVMDINLDGKELANLTENEIKSLLNRNAVYYPSEKLAKLLGIPEEGNRPESTSLDKRQQDSLIALTRPKNGSIAEFPIDEIQIVFSKPMNRDSVEKGITIKPIVEASYEWDGTNLFIIPKNLKSHTKYTVTLSSQIKTRDNELLKWGYVLEFTTGRKYTYDRDILPLINQTCAQCHDPASSNEAAQKHLLYPYKEIMKYVIPGDGNSPLLTKGLSDSMSGTEFDQKDKQIFLEWIRDDNAAEK